MNIIGLLAFYDESPSWLSTCAAGFGRVCDTIIAVDGAYALYPRARSHSMPDQREAILAAAEAAGCGCIVHQPKEVWYGNEVEKRNHLLDLARAIGTEHEDWLLVFDSDFQVMQAYPDAIREHLACTSLDVATYTLLDGKDLMDDDEQRKIAQTMDISTEWTVRIRACFRLLPDLRYEQKHWNVLATDGDGDTVTLFGPPVLQVEEYRLENSLVVYHRRKDRAKVRLQAGEEYYQVRDALQAEGGNLVAA